MIRAQPRDVIFTSCATESNNAAIHAALKANPGKKHIVTSAVEHSSVLNYCMALQKDGYRVTYLPVDRDGLLKLADLENAITDETAVVSVLSEANGSGRIALSRARSARPSAVRRFSDLRLAAPSGSASETECCLS